MYSLKDNRILKIANELNKASEQNVVNILLKVKDILESVGYDRQGSEIRLDLWKFGILQLIGVYVEQDITKKSVENILKLDDILCNSCAYLHITEDEEYMEFLHDTISIQLHLLDKFQSKYNGISIAMHAPRRNLRELIKNIFDFLQLICKGHPHLTKDVYESTTLLKFLMMDDANILEILFNFFSSIVKIFNIDQLNEQFIYHIMDELIFKIASGQVNIVGWTVRLIVIICESSNSIVQQLCVRYKGMRTLLNRWKRKGFDINLDRLILLLEAGSLQEAANQKRHRAAAKIQALWKSYKTRESFKRHNESIRRFQKSFRIKKQAKEELKFKQRIETELRNNLVIKRKENMRRFHEKNYMTIENTKPDKVDAFLQKQQEISAIKIQSLFRSHLTKKKITSLRSQMKLTRAVIILQRAVRKWLKLIKGKRNQLPAWQRPPGLDDARRVELMEKIQLYRQLNPPKTKNDNRLELHNNVQNLLKAHVNQSKSIRIAEQRRQVLLARLKLDDELLFNAQKLQNISDLDVENFRSNSVAVATKARIDHANELRSRRLPWWKQIYNEEDENYI